MSTRVRLVMKTVITAVGFAAALIAIYQFFAGPIPPAEILLAPQSETFVVSSSTLETNLPIVGDKVVVGEQLVSDDAIYIVANHLLFEEPGSLRAPEIVIFAPRITGGNLDVSGVAATFPEKPGTAGGSIFVAAARLEGTQLDSSGGNGADGQDGEDGRPGRDGECGSSLLGGDWVGATDGGHGEDGEDGGDGGDGGTITMIVSELDGFPDPIIARGFGGNPGARGRGMRGGSGCTGLGGTQASHSPGSNGNEGNPGQHGEPGTLVQKQVHFEQVKQAMEDVNLTDNGTLIGVLDNIRNQLEIGR